MEQANLNTPAGRTVYFDHLRVFATFAVIILHISSSRNWYTADVNGSEWQVLNFYDSLSRWSVPVFLMISGSLFLNREIPLKKMYSKYILRLAVAFVFWAVIYAAFAEGPVMTRITALIRGG